MSRPATLLPPATDLQALRERVRCLAENRPAVYRMTDPTGRVLYVGKAKRLRTRLLGYFRASFPDEKAARILYAAHDISWDYVPSEFAAYLGELRQIRQHRPAYNVQMNRSRRAAFVTVSTSPAPRLGVSARPDRDGVRTYGPLRSPSRIRDGLRVLNDSFGLRDCSEKMPMVFAGQGDLFGGTRQAGCMRYDLRACTGPCAGFVSEPDYRAQVEQAVAFLEGLTIAPVDRVVAGMNACSLEGDYEGALRWREKFERLEWLLAATTRARSGMELLSFIYRDPGDFGDDRAYLIRRGIIRAVFPYPTTPIEIEAFRGVVRDEIDTPTPSTGPLPSQHVEEMLLIMAWFRQHPEALRRTTSFEEWIAA